MSLKNIEVPLYEGGRLLENKKLTVNEFAGKIVLSVSEGKPESKYFKEIQVRFYFDDLERAWKAVK